MLYAASRRPRHSGQLWRVAEPVLAGDRQPGAPHSAGELDPTTVFMARWQRVADPVNATRSSPWSVSRCARIASKLSGELGHPSRGWLPRDAPTWGHLSPTIRRGRLGRRRRWRRRRRRRLRGRRGHGWLVRTRLLGRHPGGRADVLRARHGGQSPSGRALY